MEQKHKALIKYVGEYCGNFRRELGIKQAEVARDLGFCWQNISAFERGLQNNAVIFIWYLTHGLSFRGLMEYIGEQEERNNGQ